MNEEKKAIISNLKDLGYDYYENPNDVNLNVPIYRFKKLININELQLSILLEINNFNYHKHKDWSVDISAIKNINLKNQDSNFDFTIKMTSINYKDFLKNEVESELVESLKKIFGDML